MSKSDLEKRLETMSKQECQIVELSTTLLKLTDVLKEAMADKSVLPSKAAMQKFIANESVTLPARAYLHIIHTLKSAEEVLAATGKFNMPDLQNFSKELYAKFTAENEPCDCPGCTLQRAIAEAGEGDEESEPQITAMKIDPNDPSSYSHLPQAFQDVIKKVIADGGLAPPSGHTLH